MHFFFYGCLFAIQLSILFIIFPLLTDEQRIGSHLENYPIGTLGGNFDVGLESEFSTTLHHDITHAHLQMNSHFYIDLDVYSLDLPLMLMKLSKGNRMIL